MKLLLTKGGRGYDGNLYVHSGSNRCVVVIALFLVDGGSTLWLWQGWWDEEGCGEEEGVGEVRWQAERRAAMQTALAYHQLSRVAGQASPLLVWAGLEALAFTNLFPTWTDRDDIAELNIRVSHTHTSHTL